MLTFVNEEWRYVIKSGSRTIICLPEIPSCFNVPQNPQWNIVMELNSVGICTQLDFDITIHLCHTYELARVWPFLSPKLANFLALLLLDNTRIL